MKKSAKRKRWFIAVQIAISAALLYYLFSVIPFESLLQVARDADLLLLSIGTVGMMLVHWLASVQMGITLDLQKISVAVHRVLQISLISMFYSLFLPALIGGGGVRWYLFAKISDRPVESLAAIVFNRAYDTLLVVIFGVVALVANYQAALEANNVVLIVTALLLVVAAYFILFDRRVHAFGKWFIGVLPLPTVVAGKLFEFLDALSRFDDVRKGIHLKLFAVGLLRQTVAVALVMLFVIAVDIEIGVLTIAWVRSLVTILSLIPFSIAGLGIREATFVVALNQFGVPAEQALLLSLLLFARMVFYGLLGGVLEGIRVFVSEGSEPMTSRLPAETTINGDDSKQAQRFE